MRDFSPESIESNIKYTQKKLDEMNDTINFYNEIGANKDLSWNLSEAKLFETKIENLSNILKNGPERVTGAKVRVTEFGGNIVIETLNAQQFDLDFNPCGGGNIGCSLYDTGRLEMSKESVELIKKLTRVSDSIGDLMNGSSDYFSWIGQELSIKNKDSVVSRDFKMPTGYVEIENITSDRAKKVIEDRQEKSNVVDYKDLKHDMWIEFYEKEKLVEKQSGGHEYLSLGYYTIEVKIHKKYFNSNELTIVGAPEGTIKNYDLHRGDTSGRQYQLTTEEHSELKSLAESIFDGMKGKVKHSTFDFEVTAFKIPSDQVMSFINGLFNVGFDNNVMNPRMNSWRMSMNATSEDLKNALKSFKRA